MLLWVGGKAAHEGTVWAKEACVCEYALAPVWTRFHRGLGVEARMTWGRADDGSLGMAMEIRKQRESEV